MDKIVEWIRHIRHEPGVLCTVQFLQLADGLFKCKGCGKRDGPIQTCLCQQVATIGNRIRIGAEGQCPGISISLHLCAFPRGMDKGFFTTNLREDVGGNRAQGIHADQAAHPCGTNMGNIGSLTLGGDVNELLPGIWPLHACESDFYPGLFPKIGKQFQLKFIVFVRVWNGCEFNGCHVHLTGIVLRMEIVSLMVLRISGVTRVAPASMPSITAPTTGGTFNRTRRAFGASSWIVSRMGSINLAPPSNMLPVITTSKARF